MANWSDAIIAGNNLQDLALAQMLVAANNERALVGGGLHIAAPVAAQIIQSAFFWESLQGSLPVAAFIDHRTAFEGSTDIGLFDSGGVVAHGGLSPGTANWTMQDVRDEADLPVTKLCNGGTYDAAFDNTVWRRRRPREISVITAIHDVQFNAAVAGQIAYLCGDAVPAPTSPGGGNYGSLGRKFLCVAAGNWIPYGGPSSVDVLDNTQLPPNAIDALNGDLGAPGSLYGDYFGAWLFEEVRQVIDLLRWTSSYSPSDGGAAPAITASDREPVISVIAANDKGAGATAPTAAAAIAATAAAYPIAVTDGGLLPFAEYSIGFFGGVYACACARTDLTLNATFAVPLTRKYEWYAWSGMFNPGFGPPALASNIFDANGDPAQNGAWHQWDSGTAMGAVSVNLPVIGSSGTIPNVAVVPGADSTTDVQGYQMLAIAGVLKWNTAGGFAYCTAFV